MVDNIYQVRNACSKCGTIIECPYTENIRCVCTKWNCKAEFKKELQGIFGVSIRMDGEEYLISDEKSGLNSRYSSYEDLQKDLNIMEQQEGLKNKGE